MATKSNGKSQKTKTVKTPEELLKEPYARILTPDPDSGSYTAQILEFSGCVEQGDTPNEAYENLEKAAVAWIETARSLGQDIPSPSISQGFSGKIALRLPRSIHRQAAQMAERDRISLNQFLLTAVSERVGAINLYTHMMEQLRQETAQMIFAMKTTNYQVIQNYVGVSPFQYPSEFSVDFDNVDNVLVSLQSSYKVSLPNEGNQ